ncbi:MAG: hypothetical protein QOC81_4075 [Thermoanaerobaculia bacterium]|jgi:HEPN domain-containing protein|nr:hypothetical protein [Thermoanaerobaculia bacterium]
MNDFTKQKVAFAVALLAVLFTITPLLQPFGSLGYAILGVQLTLLRLYYFLSIVLALAVYFYAIQFLTERDLRYPSRLGDALYAVAIVTPALYLALFAGFAAVEAAGSRMSDFWAEGLKSVIGMFLGVISATLVQRARRAIGRRGVQVQAEQLLQEATDLLRTADTLLQTGNYNLAVLEAWKAIDIAGRRLFILSDVFRKREGAAMWTLIERYGSIPEHVMEEIQGLRRVRNAAANPASSASQEEAQTALHAAAKILAALRVAPSKDDEGQ